MQLIQARTWYARALLSLALCAFTDCAHSTTLHDIAALPPDQLQGTQIRISMLGAATKAFPPLVFNTTGASLDMARFGPYYQPHQLYSGEHLASLGFSLSTTAMATLIDSIVVDSSLANGSFDTIGRLSFAILTGPDSLPQYYELILARPRALRLFSRLQAGLSGNPTALELVHQYGCSHGLIDLPPPSFFDSQVRVQLQGTRRVGRTDQFVGRLRLTNTSGSTITARLAVAIDLQGNVTVDSPDGTTCAVGPYSLRYVLMPSGSGLLPGNSIDRLVVFRNAEREPIALGLVRVFDSSGSR